MMRVRFDVDPGYPETARAVSLALAVMRHAKVCALADLGGAIPATVDLDDDQLALLNRHLDVLGYVRHAGVDSAGVRTPTVSVAECPDCGRWHLVAGAAPSRCQLTDGCLGRPVKASLARIRKDEPPPPQTESLI